ncbi:hypothetical protein FRB99_005231 [Tulasnella sp. 403]|nr:hypothetical protein FRB99_005231 [Tulasnella sp. 403]
MQGRWSSHRKTRLNLNKPLPPSSATPPNEPATTSPEQGLENSIATLRIPEESEPVQPPKPPEHPVPTPGKRKTRTTKVLAEDPPPKRQKAGGGGVRDYTPPSTRLADLGGVQPCVEKMLELVAMPLCHPEVYLHTGVQPPRGVLLHGPPGCGKTLLANAIAGEIGVPFISISAPTIVSGMSGESEKTLRETFEEAKRVAPCLLFIDEIDAITPKRESAQREMERRIVAQFLTCMDDLSWDKTDNRPVMVIGATNRPDSLDAALRRAGRFDHEITIGVPDEEAREQILRVQSAKLRLSGDFDLRALAKATPGYVGADLAALTGAAGVIAVKRIFEGLVNGSITLPAETPTAPDPAEDTLMADTTVPPTSSSLPRPVLDAPFSGLSEEALPSTSIAHFLRAHPNPLTSTQLAPLEITAQDFRLALAEVQPSSKREGFATIPDVTWADIGALDAVRDELNMAIVQPLRWPELFKMYVGESERAVRQVFARARASSPCIIFFDELDALVPRRDDSLSEASSRVVNTLLTELDGLESRGTSVYIIGATNRPDMIDPAMCRPGRLDKLLYVDLPNAEERVDIFRTLVGAGRRGKNPNKSQKQIPIQGGFDGTVFRRVENLLRSGKAEGYSGADLASFVREAAVGALRRRLEGLDFDEDEGESAVHAMSGDKAVDVGLQDFERAMEKISPSVSLFQRRKYEALRGKLAGIPVGGASLKGAVDASREVKDGARTSS